MKKHRTMLYRQFLLISLLAVIFFLAGTRPAAAQSLDTLTATSVYEANIRATPGVKSGVIGVMPPGAQGTAIGRTSGNNWVQVQYQTTTGWVAAWLLTFSDDTILLPVTTDDQPEPLSVSATNTLFTPYNVNLRTEPNPIADVVGVIPFNTGAPVTARSTDSSWVLADYGNMHGWVAAWLIVLRTDINGLPLAAGQQPGPVNPPANQGPTPTPRPGVQPTAGPPTGGSVVSPTGVYVSAPYRVNIRTAPSIGAGVLAVLPGGVQAAALGRNAVNNWIQVQSGNTVGWVAKWVVVATDNTANLPIESDVAEVAPLPPNTVMTGTSVYPVVIRSGPSFNYGSVGEIPAGGSANLLARTSDSAWVRVNFSGVEGWAAAWVMTANADMNNLPVEAP